mmetsp:Transcript_4152/g.12420  ORF Transcript_4152/g.12420 Transcript_4152/m.12420 type:complete len:95 (+) Transcript_4152:100-384(+)
MGSERQASQRSAPMLLRLLLAVGLAASTSLECAPSDEAPCIVEAPTLLQRRFSSEPVGEPLEEEEEKEEEEEELEGGKLEDSNVEHNDLEGADD